MSSSPADPLSYIREWRTRFFAGGWWHSFDLPGGRTIEGVSSLAAQRMRIAQFPIPGRLTGKRVLDIGTWDGWFAFEMERRGAEVLAIDRFENPRFLEIRELLGSGVEYRQLDVYDISPDTVGRFDIVLFMGVLYHLKHPLLALERVCSVTREMAAVESFVLTQRHGLTPELERRNVLQFFEDDDFGGQVDNWFTPTAGCLRALCRTAGFARAELSNRHDFGAAVTCYRQWDRPASGPASSSAAPQLLAAVNAGTFGINFRSHGDEYVAACAQGAAEWSRDAVFPEVAGWGVRPVFVGAMAGGSWLVHFKLPPGLTAGWHEVRLRTEGSDFSNALRVAVDVEAVADHLEIRGACDGVTWEPGRVSLGNGFVSLWVHGLPENADIHNAQVFVDDRRQTGLFAGPPDSQGVRQLNVRLSGNPLGTRNLSVSFAGGTRSAPFAVEFVT